MKLLLDQDVWIATAQFLTERDHDVVRVAELGLAGATDETLLHVAHEQGRVFITRDRDYGTLVFVRQLGAGVLYLRMMPSTQQAVHQELARVLAQYTEQQLSHAFVVIEAGGHRFRNVTK